MTRGATLTRTQLVAEVARLVSERSTGTLFVRTAEQHTARFVVQEGEIVGIAYRATRGTAAIPLLQKLVEATVEFTAGFVFPISATEALPPAPALLQLLLDSSPPTAKEVAEEQATAAAFETLLAEFIGSFASQVMREITTASASKRVDWAAAILRMATEVDAGQVDEFIKRAHKIARP